MSNSLVVRAAPSISKQNMARLSSDIPRTEKGSVAGIPLLGLMSWATMGSQVGNDLEYVPALQWPNLIWTVQEMRNDAQVDGLTRGTMMPLTRWKWGLNPNNCDPVITRELSRDLGLPLMERTGVNGDMWTEIERPGVPRSRNRFDFQEHLAEALLATLYGHQFFEQTADMITPPADWPVSTPLRARLWKLAVRPPWTISSIDCAADGGLQAIKQLQHDYNHPGISVDELVAYVYGKEGANWVGRSILRSSYRPWLVKDRIMKVGAINIERNGAGVPIITAPLGATTPQIRALNDLATKVRGGDSSGGAIPHGATLNLMGVMGSQPDAEGFMRFLNEEMARAFLQMVQQLGQTSSGSRALGKTFLEMMTWMLESIADWFCSVFYNHMILDWLDWNVPQPDDPNEDQFAPMLVYQREGQATDQLNNAIANGDIQVDPNTQEQIQQDPNASPPNSTAQNAARGHQPSRRHAGAGHDARVLGTAEERRVSGSGSLSLPARTLRRQPYTHEVAAATDFAALDSAYASALDLLFMNVRGLIPYQIAELHDAIIEANGDLTAISEISATPQAADIISTQLTQVVALAATEAVNEASRQGHQVERPSLTDLEASLVARAAIIDTMIARDVTEAAVRRAVRMTGGALDPTDVAAQVREELSSMTWTGVRDQLGGAVQGSQNSGRALVFRRDGEPGTIYASELLDSNTCQHCVANDGTPYDTMDEAEQHYPFGGFIECEGRERCRGTIIKVYASENAPVLQEPAT